MVTDGQLQISCLSRTNMQEKLHSVAYQKHLFALSGMQVQLRQEHLSCMVHSRKSRSREHPKAKYGGEQGFSWTGMPWPCCDSRQPAEIVCALLVAIERMMTSICLYLQIYRTIEMDPREGDTFIIVTTITRT